MRLYRNLISPCIQGLTDIFEKGLLAPKVVENLLKSNKKWGSRDRRFIADTIYTAVRWYRLYYEILGFEPKATADWWQFLGVQFIAQGVELPDWEDFQGLETATILERKETLSKERKIRCSIPDWLDERGERELGDAWTTIMEASNDPAPVVLRCNSLKTDMANLKRRLEKDQIQIEQLNEHALLLKKRQKLAHLKTYQQGLFEIQDASSQEVAPFLDVKAGMTVVDTCAGAGGKSLHLAALMNNKGKITSLDVEAYKLKELERRSKRAGARIIKTTPIENELTIKSLYNTADRVLMDVPCSGLGVLKRNAYAKWRLSDEYIDNIRETQQYILQNYCQVCKVGGKIVYATCSILPSENEEQVKEFLSSEIGHNFRLIEERSIVPNEGFDGFYMALLERIN